MKKTVIWITAIFLVLAALPAFGQERRKRSGRKPPQKAPVAAAEATNDEAKPEAKAEEPKDAGAGKLRFPDIHEDKIVFMHGGDLWLTTSEGGIARRLTSHPGPEAFPRFSPDGKFIAFAGYYDGNLDVYVIPSEGGEPQRKTWHPAPDRAPARAM